MTVQHSDGVSTRSILSPDELNDINTLAQVCNQHDHITLKLNEDTLKLRLGDKNTDFLYYIDHQLVGFLAIYQFNNHEVEISGMVHPAHRRRKIFSALATAAQSEVRERGISKLIFINASESQAGKSYLEANGIHYAFSEHWMKMTRTTELPMPHPVSLQLSTTADIPVMAHMIAVCFKMDEANLLEEMTVKDEFSETSQKFLVYLQQDAIGTLSMNYPQKGGAFIFGFCILPEYQGQGYGRQALALAIQQAQNSQLSPIELEVACENIHALSLYQSCGFDVLRANDYYVLNLV